MEKELVEGKLGSVGKYDVALKGGSLEADLTAESQFVDLSVSVKVKGAAVLDVVVAKFVANVKAKIPGPIDDMILDAVVAELRALLS